MILESFRWGDQMCYLLIFSAIMFGMLITVYASSVLVQGLVD